MKIQSINSVPHSQNRNKNTSFGSVIPVSINLNGKKVQQTIENTKLFDSIVRRFNIMLGKGNGVFRDIAEKFKATDSDFDGVVNSIRGNNRALWGRRRYLVTGPDREFLKQCGRNIGYNKNWTSHEIYKNNEFALRTNKNRFIDGIESFVIDVKSRIIKQKNGKDKTVYDIIGGDFVKSPAKSAQTAANSPKASDSAKFVQGELF